MDMLYTVLLADLSMVLVCYAILLLAFASNVVLSLYHNINITGETFDAKRLWQGIKKALVLVIGTMLMVAAVDAATTLLTQYVPDINEQVHDLITVAMIAATIGVAAWRYIKDAYSTFINILNGKPSEVAAAVIAVGKKVKVKKTAKTYATGQSIPAFVKGTTYTIMQISGEKVLLKEIMSWVCKSDLE